MAFNFKIGDIVSFPTGNPEIPSEQFKVLRKEFGKQGVTIWRFIDLNGQYENDLGLTDHEVQMNFDRAHQLQGRIH
jgi:hypothetical protein